MTLVSPHFTFEELTFSEIALRKGLDNTPDAAQRMNLSRLANQMLEPVRDLLQVPIRINSGFRSPAVNTAVGSTAMHSAHLDGLAADFVPVGLALRNAFDAIRSNLKGWDRMIIECNAWIHIAIPEAGDPARMLAEVASGTPGNWTYTNVA